MSCAILLMKDDARLFVGLELGDEARAALGAYRRAIERLVAGKLADLPQVTFEVKHITLFESTRVDGRLAYVPLYRTNRE